jgi:hypothetical protein
MQIIDGEVHEGDVLTYDCRSMAGYGQSYQVQATVRGVRGDKANVEYVNQFGGRVRRVVSLRFLYKQA